MSAFTSERILVVDDEPVIVEALRRVLTAAGYSVATAPDAETGLEMFATEKPGVVVIDLKLPGMSGLDFLPMAVEADPTVVTVLMSGFSSTEHVVLSLQAGAFTFLAKPFTFEEARNAVERAVRYRKLPMPERKPSGVSGPGAALFGVQGWCRVAPDGTGLVGVTDVYIRTMGRPAHVHAPPIGYPLMQGDVLARIEDTRGGTYIAWSALGGRVLEINRRVLENPLLLAHEPAAGGWLARVQASTPHEDLERLRGNGDAALRSSVVGPGE